MLNWAGLGFSEEDNYRISISLRRLLDDTGAINLRFWGKIYATKSDYYVACGKVDRKVPDEIEDDVEPRGKGVNEITYWVTDDLLEKWIELPLISPHHIKIARYS
jgi:hypothetical protein